MPTSNPFDVLIAHDRWATRQILLACERLSLEQFHKKFEMGPGSLHNTTLHMISAMSRWTDGLWGREFGPLIDPAKSPHTVEQLLKLHGKVADEFEEVARKFPLDGTMKRERDGKTYVFTRGAVITHVTTHGMHHRAQCLNMLRQVGVNPLPLSSVVEWIRTVDHPQ